MNKVLIEKLKIGIPLERCGLILPWNTSFEDLKLIGDPELKIYSNQRTDLIWNNESILGGIDVNLTVMKWRGFGGRHKKTKTYIFKYNTRGIRYIKEKIET